MNPNKMKGIDRKKRYRKWGNTHAGCCRSCGTIYVPERPRPSGDEAGDVEEMEYCSGCALRCPNCEEWLTSVDVVLQGWWRYQLSRNEETGGLHLAECKATYDERLRQPQCPYCGQDLDRDLVGL